VKLTLIFNTVSYSLQSMVANDQINTVSLFCLSAQISKNFVPTKPDYQGGTVFVV